MKHFLILITTIALILPTIASASDSTEYGAGLTLEKAVTIEALLAKPADYVGKKIQINGTITNVCKMRGCWMQLSNSKGQSMRIKVQDGVMVFPYTAKGQQASAEGIFEAHKLSPEQIEARKAAAAAEHEGHEGCDKSKKSKHSGGGAQDAGCDAPAVNDTVFMIRGTGAVIES